MTWKLFYICKGALRLVLCNNLLLNNPKSLSLHGIQTIEKLSAAARSRGRF
jgi:hypothetical protein